MKICLRKYNNLSRTTFIFKFRNNCKHNITSTTTTTTTNNNNNTTTTTTTEVITITEYSEGLSSSPGNEPLAL